MRQIWLWGAIEVGRPVGEERFVFHILRKAEDALEGRPRGKAELERVLRSAVLPGTRLVTDSWRAYLHMDWDALEIERKAVSHAHEFVNAEGCHTNRIEAQWSVLKRWLRRRYHGRLPDRDDLYLYLFEFVWRRRVKEPFYAILEAMGANYSGDAPLGKDRQALLAARLAEVDQD